MDFDGEMDHDTDGSNLIKEIMQATDDGEYNLVKYLRTVITVK